MSARQSAGLAAIIIALAVGCAAPQLNPSEHQPTLTAASQFDPRWMGLTPNQPRGWEELSRSITSEFQKFYLRPVDETEYRYGCNGCSPSTVDLTAYAPGTFDSTQAQTGRPVGVNGDGDGYLTEDPEKHAATLSWQYAEDSWATVRAMTSATVELDRMVDLARALNPAEWTPIRLPLALANLPADLPLAQIDVDTHRDAPGLSDYGTRVEFAACGRTEDGAIRDCFLAADNLSVHISEDDYREPTGGVPHVVVPVNVGGRDGCYDETIHRVSVQLRPGMLVQFEPGGREQSAVQDILADVVWAPDPADESTWPTVSDWTK